MRIMNDPYGLNPEGERQGPDSAEGFGVRFDDQFDQWTAPFVMAPLDTKVVRRTNALLGYPYGRDFCYGEATLMGKGGLAAAKAVATAVGTVATMGAMAIGPLRRLLASRLPQPGEGPSKEKRERGYFDLRLIADHPSDPGKQLRGRVTGDRDPGYGSTSKMLAESALCLARDEIEERGGFWTPASAMGVPLLERLQKSAGLTFEILEA
ncbi:MAG: saccharopine dehydrogenase, partial [Myxococcota bacterium]